VIAATPRDSATGICCNSFTFTGRRAIMSVISHVQELKKKHQTLSDHVAVMQRNPGADDLELAKLKKKKLQLKEEITRLGAH
jgi:hypothetical protein